MRLVHASARAQLSRALAVALAAVALAGCGGGDDEAQDGAGLVWDEPPKETRLETLPDDRILSGTVRNDASGAVSVEAPAIRVVDEDGRPLKASAIFLQSYLHRLDPPTRERPVSEEERRRTGLLAVLEPGETAPLTVSWREKDGRRAARIDYGDGFLPVR